MQKGNRDGIFYLNVLGLWTQPCFLKTNETWADLQALFIAFAKFEKMSNSQRY